MNNVTRTEDFVTQFPCGATYHIHVEVSRRIEWNVLKWFISYSVNGRVMDGETPFAYERFAGWGARFHPMYLHTWDAALFSGKMAALNRIENFRMAIDQPMFVRMQKILNTIRYDAVLQKLVNGVYPDVLNDRITIQCADVYQDTLYNAIAGLTDGISIVWKTYTVQPFTGLIADTQERIAS